MLENKGFKARWLKSDELNKKIIEEIISVKIG